eukprot:jgi/Mesvir1/1052/Mv17575-RA.1
MSTECPTCPKLQSVIDELTVALRSLLHSKVEVVQFFERLARVEDILLSHGLTSLSSTPTASSALGSKHGNSDAISDNSQGIDDNFPVGHESRSADLASSHDAAVLVERHAVGEACLSQAVAGPATLPSEPDSEGLEDASARGSKAKAAAAASGWGSPVGAPPGLPAIRVPGHSSGAKRKQGPASDAQSTSNPLGDGSKPTVTHASSAPSPLCVPSSVPQSSPAFVPPMGPAWPSTVTAHPVSASSMPPTSIGYHYGTAQRTASGWQGSHPSQWGEGPRWSGGFQPPVSGQPYRPELAAPPFTSVPSASSNNKELSTGWSIPAPGPAPAPVALPAHAASSERTAPSLPGGTAITNRSSNDGQNVNHSKGPEYKVTGVPPAHAPGWGISVHSATLQGWGNPAPAAWALAGHAPGPIASVPSTYDAPTAAAPTSRASVTSVGALTAHSARIKGDGAASPPQDGSSPPQDGSSPPQDGSSPPQDGSSPPPQGSASPPPQGSASPPPQGSASPPPQGSASPPPQGSVSGGWDPLDDAQAVGTAGSCVTAVPTEDPPREHATPQEPLAGKGGEKVARLGEGGGPPLPGEGGQQASSSSSVGEEQPLPGEGGEGGPLAHGTSAPYSGGPAPSTGDVGKLGGESWEEPLPAHVPRPPVVAVLPPIRAVDPIRLDEGHMVKSAPATYLPVSFCAGWDGGLAEHDRGAGQAQAGASEGQELMTKGGAELTSGHVEASTGQGEASKGKAEAREEQADASKGQAKDGQGHGEASKGEEDGRGQAEQGAAVHPNRAEDELVVGSVVPLLPSNGDAVVAVGAAHENMDGEEAEAGLEAEAASQAWVGCVGNQAGGASHTCAMPEMAATANAGTGWGMPQPSSDASSVMKGWGSSISNSSSCSSTANGSGGSGMMTKGWGGGSTGATGWGGAAVAAGDAGCAPPGPVATVVAPVTAATVGPASAAATEPSSSVAAHGATTRVADHPSSSGPGCPHVAQSPAQATGWGRALPAPSPTPPVLQHCGTVQSPPPALPPGGATSSASPALPLLLSGAATPAVVADGSAIPPSASVATEARQGSGPCAATIRCNANTGLPSPAVAAAAAAATAAMAAVAVASPSQGEVAVPPSSVPAGISGWGVSAQGAAGWDAPTSTMAAAPSAITCTGGTGWGGGQTPSITGWVGVTTSNYTGGGGEKTSTGGGGGRPHPSLQVQVVPGGALRLPAWLPTQTTTAPAQMITTPAEATSPAVTAPVLGGVPPPSHTALFNFHPTPPRLYLHLHRRLLRQHLLSRLLNRKGQGGQAPPCPRSQRPGVWPSQPTWVVQASQVATASGAAWQWLLASPQRHPVRPGMAGPLGMGPEAMPEEIIDVPKGIPMI